MDQVSRSGVGSDVTDETASMGEYRWSSEEHEMSDPQGQCLAAPQALPAPTYKQKVEEFKKLFRELPESERLIMDYTCALQRDILLQGRLYLSENWLCFYSNVFRGTKIALTLRDIKAMYREKTARLIPNAIQICTDSEKLFFTSFSAREKSYQGVFRMWQNTLMDKVVVTVLSHRCNSHMDSGEAKIKSHASSETQHNPTKPHNAHPTRKPASPMCRRKHLATLSACTVPGPPQESLVRNETRISLPAKPSPNLDDAGPIVRRPMSLPVAAGCNRAWARTQNL